MIPYSLGDTKPVKTKEYVVTENGITNIVVSSRPYPGSRTLEEYQQALQLVQQIARMRPYSPVGTEPEATVNRLIETARNIEKWS